MRLRSLCQGLREFRSLIETMPSLWKKGKKTKISNLVSNHLGSQRLRGGSLVVETGFPASLVDLFVKNSKRLKKSSKMRKTNSDSLIVESPFPLASTSPVLRSSPLPSTLLNNMVEQTHEVGKEVKEDGNFKGVVMAVLRMFFVVVLALGTKKFAVGLTMSAIFLFFVEYVGIYLYRLLMPCSEAKKRLMLIMRIPKFFTIREERLGGENRGFKEPMDPREEISGCSVLQNHRLVSPNCEVQIVRPKGFLVPFIEDIQLAEEEGIDEFGSERQLILQGSESMVAVLEKEEEYRCDVSEVKKTKSRRDKIRTKVKHLFHRKSRSAKKEEPNLVAEVGPIGGENVMIGKKQMEDADGNEQELKSSSNLSSSSSGSYKGEKAIGDAGVLLNEDIDGVVIREEEIIHKKGTSECLFLLLIVLIGLFGGRIHAFMLILSWCFIKKSVAKLQRCLTWACDHVFFPDV